MGKNMQEKIKYGFSVVCIFFCACFCNAQSGNYNDKGKIKDSIEIKQSSLKSKAKTQKQAIRESAERQYQGEKKIVSELKERGKQYESKHNGKEFPLTGCDSLKHLTKSNSKHARKNARVAVNKERDSFSNIVSDRIDTNALKKNDINTKLQKKRIDSIHTPFFDCNMINNKLPKETIFSKKRKSIEFNKDKKSVIRNYAGKAGINSNIQTEIDSTKTNTMNTIMNQVKKNIKGSVSLGYEYGILPYVPPEKYPTGGFKSEGRVSVMVFNIPVEVTYRYTTVKGGIGINNFFRVAYDVNRYKDELEKKTALKQRLKKVELDNLEINRQEMAMKMEYMKMLSNLELPVFSMPDTSFSVNMNLPTVNSDTLGSFKNAKMDFPTKMQIYVRQRDSILKLTEQGKAKYLEYKAKYDSLLLAIEKIKKGSQQIKEFGNKGKIPRTDIKSKAETFLQNIRKFEIGLCNPTYSLFMLSNSPLKGVNLEYETKEHFFAITYGTTVNTAFYNPNTLQGKIQEVKNFYNFLDLNDFSSGRKILALKGGKGKKEGNHFFTGILLGRGRMDYLSTIDPKYGKKECNVVVELDGKYAFSDQLSADIIFGKSSLQTEDISIEQIKKSFREIVSSYRSNAMQVRLNYDLQKTNTKIQLISRWIDPYFKSFGVSFLRSDNIRYEIKADQVITKNIKYSFSYRKEEDNLLELFDYKNIFTTISNGLSIRMPKGISIRLNYSPLVRTFINGDQRIRDFNSISTAMIAYVPRSKHVQINYNILYSKYNVISDSANIHFGNISYSHQFQFENGFKTSATTSWFNNTSKDTLNNKTYLCVVDIGYTSARQNSFTIGGKSAFKRGFQAEYGFIAKITIKVLNNTFWETESEKILTGDYYSNLIESKIDRFPFYISSKLIVNF